MPSLPTLHAIQQSRYQSTLSQYREYHPLIQQVQEELNAVAEELIDQEGWEKDVREGVREWASDRGVSWRALRVSVRVRVRKQGIQLGMDRNGLMIIVLATNPVHEDKWSQA
jgi:hypothetical protein